MFDRSILLLLLVTPQDTPRTDPEGDRARRAAIVDRIMAEPARPRTPRPEPAEAQAQLPEPQPARPILARVQIQNQKQMTLELKEITPEEKEAEGEDQGPMRRARPFLMNEMALTRDNFDRWVFGEGVDEENRRNHLNSLLSGKILVLETSGEITVEQSEKLRIAGRGDIKRFFDRAEDRRNDFEVARKDFATGRLALGQLEPLSKDYQAGPFGSDSIFAKTLTKMRIDANGARRVDK